MLTAVSKKAAHFPLFVKCFFENSYKKLGHAFLRNPAFLNLVTLGHDPALQFLMNCDVDKTRSAAQTGIEVKKDERRGKEAPVLGDR